MNVSHTILDNITRFYLLFDSEKYNSDDAKNNINSSLYDFLILCMLRKFK